MSHIKTYYLLIIITLFTITCSAQDTIKRMKMLSKNAVYIEVFGNVYTSHDYLKKSYLERGTINYERTLKANNLRWWTLRAGFTASQITLNRSAVVHTIVNIPIMINVITNPMGNNHVENGFGLVFTHYSDPYEGDDDQLGITYSIKYRYQNTKKTGIFFTFGYTPSFFPKEAFYDFASPIYHLIFGGLSIGYHF